jgi:hypothetical protein
MNPKENPEEILNPVADQKELSPIELLEQKLYSAEQNHQALLKASEHCPIIDAELRQNIDEAYSACFNARANLEMAQKQEQDKKKDK